MVENLHPLKELENLSIEGICNMPQIEWWLLKHHEAYNKTYEIESKKFCFNIDGESIRLPTEFNKPSEEEIFLNIYQELDKVSKFHRHENYFKEEIAIYKEIKNQPYEVIKWLAKNEELGTKEYVCFAIDYFGDEDELEMTTHLQPYHLNDMQRQIYIERTDFNHTIEFLSIFDDIYWEMLGDLNSIKQLL